MKLRWLSLSATAFACALLACGSDAGTAGDDDAESDDGSSGSSGSSGGAAVGSGANRGGPESLSGFAWTGDPQIVNGVQLQLSFRFDETSVTATNTCGEESSATVSSPVRYHYTADILEASNEETKDGDNTCTVSISKGKLAFELVGNKLRVTADGQSLEFEPSGTRSGLYGEWTAAGNGQTLKWSMKDGIIRATADCSNGLSATTESDAKYTNFFDIPEAVEKTEEDGFGGECSVSIAKGNYQYRFDGDALILADETGGSEVRFAKK